MDPNIISPIPKEDIVQPAPKPESNPMKWFNMFFGQDHVDKVKTQVADKMATLPDKVTPTPTQVDPRTYKFKYARTIGRIAQTENVPLQAFHLLRSSENMAENPDAVNYNDNGTVDVGLFQINVDPKNTEEVQNLKDPEYNATRAAEIFKQRMQIFNDPVLAIASYNLGAGGAVTNPQAAIARAKLVYAKAGLKMPETAFTKDPIAFIKQNMQNYIKMGLVKGNK